MILSLIGKALYAPGRLHVPPWDHLDWVVSRTVAPAIALGRMAILLIPYDHDLDLPIWSLGVEIRMSLLLPIVIWVMRRHRSAWSSLAMLLASDALSLWHLTFLPLFVLGACIVNHRRAIVDAAERLSAITACAIALAAGMLWTGLYVSRPGTMPWLAIQGVGIASAVIVIGAMSRPGVRTVLLKQPIQALGRVSYAFYLLHFPALLLIVCWLMPIIGYWPSVLVAAASTWLASIVVFRVVERPCMAIARRLGAAFHRSHAHNG